MRRLNERAEIALRVGESKKEAGLSFCDHTREREVIERMIEANQGPLDDRAIVELLAPAFMNPAGSKTAVLPQRLSPRHNRVSSCLCG